MAQNISGKIVDAKGEPLAFANVVLLNRQDSAFVKGTVSGEDGHFTIDSPCNGGIIKVTSVGYKTIFKDCKGDNVGVIKMEEDSKMLGEVVIKSSLPKTVLKNGGMMTTIVGSVLEKAGTMEHLLDRIPNVSAQNGNIKVFGRGEPIIYINGRQMRDRSELDRLSSDNIKSVEVISNPGARYAASTKAVIRITTKKIQGDGFGFDATTEGSYDEKKNIGGYGRLNMYYRKNGLELGAYAYGAKQSSPDEKDLQQMTYLYKAWNQQDKTRWKNKTTSHKDIVFKNLYYNPSVEQQIQRLHSLLEEKNFRMVQKRLQERGFHKGIACLFYGSPGTGKTETVLQLAKSSGRDVMQVSMSQIRSKWVGESQKNIQEVFASYKERVRASKLCPILLFNEADAIIGNRMEVTTSSVDKMENSIQNVILQEMENLEGIMIATTNLERSLDAAFERRFLYKIKFEKPSLQVRTKIWQSMLPDVDEATLSSIASQYDFSGGQIENIARKALVDDLLFYSSDISNKERISTFCRQEVLSKNVIKGFSL